MIKTEAELDYYLNLISEKIKNLEKDIETAEQDVSLDIDNIIKEKKRTKKGKAISEKLSKLREYDQEDLIKTKKKYIMKAIDELNDMKEQIILQKELEKAK